MNRAAILLSGALVLFLRLPASAENPAELYSTPARIADLQKRMSASPRDLTQLVIFSRQWASLKEGLEILKRDPSLEPGSYASIEQAQSATADIQRMLFSGFMKATARTEARLRKQVERMGLFEVPVSDWPDLTQRQWAETLEPFGRDQAPLILRKIGDIGTLVSQVQEQRDQFASAFEMADDPFRKDITIAIHTVRQ